jgi:biotin carboxyl carrier protein
MRLVLTRGAATRSPARTAASGPALPLGVVAPAFGRFLRRHPLHDRDLVADGAAVVAGQPLAVLCIGVLLVPVLSPAAGIVAGAGVAEGALAGYGDRLFDLWPTPDGGSDADRP